MGHLVHFKMQMQIRWGSHVFDLARTEERAKVWVWGSGARARGGGAATIRAIDVLGAA